MKFIIENRTELIKTINEFKSDNKQIVFTNGCFDIIHAGHIDYLSKAKEFGDILIVAINSDVSVKSIKGNKRPIIPQNERALIVSNLKPVDIVTFFDEDTPEIIIKDILPDYLVKGADWEIDKVVGRKIVESNGGEVKTIEFIYSSSTSRIIEKILDLYK
jgi:rfaE bifunctional protein nucleotidyltransferase chain/domain